MTQQSAETIKPYPNVLIYGSGLSGLVTALKLARENIRTDILHTPDDNLSPGYLHDFLDDSMMISRLREETLHNGKITSIPSKNLHNQVITTENSFLFTTNNGDGQTQEYGTIIFAPERLERQSDIDGALNLTQLYSKLIPDPSRKQVSGERIKGIVVFLLEHQTQFQAEVFQDVLQAAAHLQKQANTEVWVLAQEVQVAFRGQQELYDGCRENGVVFIKYQDDVTIQSNNGHFELTGFDIQVDSAFTISRPNTLVIPQKAVLLPSALAFAESLNLRILNEQYTQPDSLWRLPNETNRPGIFAAGSARGNMVRQAIIADAASVALSVQERLKPEGIPVKENIPVIDKGKCVYCLSCVRTCPFGAMQKGKGQGMAASVNRLACQACGTCVAVCPAGALQLRNEILDFR